MRTTDRAMHESQRIHRRPTAFVKSGFERADRNFGRYRTVRVSPHAVDRDQQGRVAVPEERDAVLVLTAVADQTACGDINVHDFPCVDLRSDW